jgi:hypothetical protein
MATSLGVSAQLQCLFCVSPKQTVNSFCFNETLSRIRRTVSSDCKNDPSGGKKCPFFGLAAGFDKKLWRSNSQNTANDKAAFAGFFSL